MIRGRLILFVVSATILLCACAPDNRKAEESSGLPLPDVPEQLTEPHQRADYIMTRFWDSMDFSDTLRSRDRKFMESNLVAFMSLFEQGSGGATSLSIGRLLAAAGKDTAAFRIVTSVMERYLDDPNSPMRNESHYILYLEQLLRRHGMPEADSIRYSYRLKTARKNRPGSVATDFAYTDRTGRSTTLLATQGKRILLLFYDPECDHCSEILRQVGESSVVRDCIGRGELTVLAVYTEGKRRVWDESKAAMPQEWKVGFDTDRIVDRELYSIPAMPVMYLLDSDKKVLLKDAALTQIEERLNTIVP